MTAHSAADVRDWERDRVTKMVWSTLDELEEAARNNIRQALLENEFHEATRWLGCLEAIERVKEIPQALRNALEEDTDEQQH